VFWFVAARQLRPAPSRDAAREEATEGGEEQRATPPVSVVVAVRNGEDLLDELIRGLLAQDYPNFELVICDDASTDGTYAKLSEWSRADERLRIIRVQQKRLPGKKQALAQAIKYAQHEWLLTTDVDCRPESTTWISMMIAARRADSELVLGYSPYALRNGWLNRWIRFEGVYTALQYLTSALIGRPYMGVGRNLLYSRGLYDRVGGFADHEHLAGGDDDLLVSAGATATNTVAATARPAWVWSLPSESWRAYYRQKTRHVSVSNAYRLPDKMWLTGLAASHLVFYFGVLAVAGLGLAKLAAALYALRLLALWPQSATLLKRLGHPDLVVWWPLLDAGLVFYYVVFAGAALFPRAASEKW